MIIVEQNELGLIELSFKYYPDYITRVKQLGARFNPENKTWAIDNSLINKLEELFKGELYYKTPKWEITGEKAPDYSQMYTFENECSIKDIGFKLKPFNYQEFGIKFLVDRLNKNGMAFIADDVGLGKTIQAIGAMKHLLNEGLVKDIVIVCKKSLKHQWKDEIEKFINFDGDIYIADDNKKKRMKIYNEIKNNNKSTILIINYHLLLNDSKYINANMVVFDEVHIAKKVGGEINKGCAAITKNADYCLFMTGTPIMSRPDDMYGIISIKDKKYFGKKTEFDKKYINKYYNGRYENVVGYKNLDELREKMQNIILRRTSEEVTIDLPEVVTIDKYCNLDGKQEDCLELAKAKSLECEERIDELKTRYVNNRNNANSIELKNQIAFLEGALKGFIATEQAIANSPVLFHYSKSKGVRETYKDLTPSTSYLSNKMQTLLDLCEEILSAGKKVVIFSKYETVATYVTNLLNRNKIKATAYVGKMNDEERSSSVNSFKNDEEMVAIVGTDAMAEGLNLQIANTVINIDLPFNQAIYNQRIGRVRRAGSSHKTAFVYNLLTKDSIDINIYNKIKETQNAFDSFVSVNKAQSDLLKRLSS